MAFELHGDACIQIEITWPKYTTAHAIRLVFHIPEYSRAFVKRRSCITCSRIRFGIALYMERQKVVPMGDASDKKLTIKNFKFARVEHKAKHLSPSSSNWLQRRLVAFLLRIAG